MSTAELSELPVDTIPPGMTRREFINLDNAESPEEYDLIVRVITISPKTAKKWLELNIKNRHLKRRSISYIARQLKAGRYALNGETIIFSVEGYLLDGQNRLNAIIKADKAMKSLVVFGIDTSVQNTIDTGVQRGGSDTLTIAGEKNCSVLGVATKVLYGYMKDELYINRTPYLVNAEIELLLGAFPELRESCTATRGAREVVGHGWAAALHCVFATIDREKADEFFVRLSTPKEQAPRSTLKKLNDYFTTEYKKRGSRANLEKNKVCAALIKGWNAFYSGKRVGDFDSIEAFPSIEGVPSPFNTRVRKFLATIPEVK